MLTKLPDTPNFHLLLKTTETLIHEKGCQHTTLQEIMNRSGLSKGAIYHYVRSKDELFGLILQIRMEHINDQFVQAASRQDAGLGGPLGEIAKSMGYLTDVNDVSNIIFTYLLGRKEQPSIEKILRSVYEHSKKKSVSWIETGQRAGVIPETVDAEQMAVMFLTFSYGLRVRTMINPDDDTVTVDDIYDFMYQALRNP